VRRLSWVRPYYKSGGEVRKTAKGVSEKRSKIAEKKWLGRPVDKLCRVSPTKHKGKN